LYETEYGSPRRFSPGCIAIPIGLQENGHAFEWLDRGYEERDYALTSLRVAPFFDPLRSDARFTQLLNKVELKE
jgi:hypothetical protein